MVTEIQLKAYKKVRYVTFEWFDPERIKQICGYNS
jgi:hypothetical protein